MIRAGLAAALGLALSVALAPAWARCPPLPADGSLIAAPPAQLAWRVDGVPAPIALGRHFALQLQVCPADARLLRVDASMPEHRHGMNYRPSLKALGDGRWQAEGLLFHMAGRWELAFDVEVDGRAVTLRQSIVLP